MENCIFCKIVNKTIPADIITEDKDFIAFLDINPVKEGHTLVVSKKHYKWVWDVEKFCDYGEFCKKIAKALQKSMNTEWVTMGVEGTDVPHAHIHIVPRHKGDGLPGYIRPENQKKFSKEQMKVTAEKIRKFL
ncbi:HIT family protein [Candidatus Woesearchaeota archaeon]|nr:HIT family protein [Candidatus Woesearchaeota archaeon]